MVVNVGVEAFQLPCLFYDVSKDITVVWIYNDSHHLNPSTIHVRDHKPDQQERFSKTSMQPNALETVDYSLTLKNLQLSDTGTYVCIIREFEAEQALKEVQLQVKGQQ